VFVRGYPTLSAHQKPTEVNRAGPGGKLAYSLSELSDMGIVSRTRAYVENRSGRLIFRKMGRRTIILHADLIDWLQHLPRKDANSRAEDALANEENLD